MVKLSLIPTASPIHPKSRWARKIDEIVKKISQANIEFELTKCITSLEEALKFKMETDAAGTIIIVLTGGTSTIAKEVALRSKKPIAFLAHGEDNSLPSAIEAREKLKIEGIYSKLLYVDLEQKTLNKELKVFANVAKAYDYLSNLKIIGIETNLNNYISIGEIKIKIINVSEEELSSTMKSINDIEVAQLEEELTKRTEITDISESDLKKSIKLYLAIRRLMKKYGANGVTFNCFKFILKYKITPCLTISLTNSNGFIGACEAEVPAAIAMIIGSSLSTKPSFMGNLSAFNIKSNTITLAHCTAPLNIAEGKARLVRHFETGLSVSLDVPMSRQDVTLLSLSKDLSQLMAIEGEILQSSMKNPSMCRTQVEVKLSVPVEKFMEKALGNHQTIVFCKVREVIEELAKNLGVEFVSP